jgi:hypothetical protein
VSAPVEHATAPHDEAHSHARRCSTWKLHGDRAWLLRRRPSAPRHGEHERASSAVIDAKRRASGAGARRALPGNPRGEGRRAGRSKSPRASANFWEFEMFGVKTSPGGFCSRLLALSPKSQRMLQTLPSLLHESCEGGSLGATRARRVRSLWSTLVIPDVMTLETFTDVRTLIGHLPADRRDRTMSPRSLGKAAAGSALAWWSSKRFFASASAVVREGDSNGGSAAR